MNSIKTTIFEPEFRGTIDNLKELLKYEEDQTAHVLDKTLLIKKNKTEFDTIDISQKDKNFFLSNVNVNQVSNNIIEKIAKINCLKEFKSYDIEVGKPDKFISIPFTKDIFAFIISIRDPTYYDFCAEYDNQICYYNNKQTATFYHSGDLTFGQNLIHTIGIRKLHNNKKFSMGVNGYNLTPLYNFEKQAPSLLLIDRELKKLWLVPIPLDKASINDANLAVRLIGKRTEDQLLFKILEKPLTDQKINLQKTLCLKNCFNNTNSFEFIEQNNTLQKTKEIKQEQVKQECQKHTNQIVIQKKHSKRIIFVEDGLELDSLFENDENYYVNYSLGLHFSETFQKQKKEIMTLPCIVGQLRNNLILSLGKQASGDNIDYKHLVTNSDIRIILTSDIMTDQAKYTSTTKRLTGIYIIKPEKINTNQDIKTILLDLNCNNITSMASPQSFVFVKIKDNYYFYRGLHYKDYELEFGDCCNDLIKELINDHDYFKNYETFVDIEDKNIIYQNITIPYNNILSIFNNITINYLTENKKDIKDIFVQIGSLLNNQEIIKFSEDLLKLVNDKIINKMKDYKYKLFEIYSNITDSNSNYQEKEDQKESYVQELKKYKKEINWLKHSLANIISVLNSNTQRNNLNNIIRKNTVYDNVKKSQSMGFEDLENILYDDCSDMGVLITNVDITKLNNNLTYANNENFRKLKQYNKQIISLESRNFLLDSYTIAPIIEITKDITTHPLYNKNLNLATPKSIQETNKSNIAWFLFDKYVNLKNPSTINWYTECNKEMEAKIRILMRATITNNRELNINPSTHEIGFVLIDMIFCIMKDLTKDTTPSDYDSTIAKIMRGLFGNLFLIASSGVIALTNLVKLLTINKNIYIKNTNEWIYLNTIKYFPYTKWDQTIINQNKTKVFNRIIYNKITRQNTHMIYNDAQLSSNIYNTKRNDILLDIYYIITTFEYFRENNIKNDSRIIYLKEIQNLVKCPTHHKRNIILYRFIDHIINRTEHNEEYFYKGLIDTYFKRSRCFKEDKLELIECLKQNKDSTEIKERIINKVNLINSYYNTKGKPKNYDSIINGDLEKLLSDADHSAQPYSVNNTITVTKECKTNILNILNGVYNKQQKEECQEKQIIDKNKEIEDNYLI